MRGRRRVNHSECMLLVMAMVEWVGEGMEVVDGMHAGHSQGGWSHVGKFRSTSRVLSD